MSPASSSRIRLVLLSASSTVRTIRWSEPSCWRASFSTSQRDRAGGIGSGRRGRAARGDSRRRRCAISPSCVSQNSPGRRPAPSDRRVLLDGRRPEHPHADAGDVVGDASTAVPALRYSPPRSARSARRGTRSPRGSAPGPARGGRAGRRTLFAAASRVSELDARGEPVAGGELVGEVRVGSRSSAAGASASRGSVGCSVQGRTTSFGLQAGDHRRGVVDRRSRRGGRGGGG